MSNVDVIEKGMGLLLRVQRGPLQSVIKEKVGLQLAEEEKQLLQRRRTEEELELP